MTIATVMYRAIVRHRLVLLRSVLGVLRFIPLLVSMLLHVGKNWAMRQDHFKKKLRYILCWIIDERSLLGAKTVAGAERNIRETVYNEHGKAMAWGDIPVIILFGDDYQLPPVLVDGAISLFGNRADLRKKNLQQKPTRQSPDSQNFN